MPQLLSVNVGLPRDIEWHGEVVRTAVWKESVQGKRMVRRLNIDGDGQGDLAGHGGEYFESGIGAEVDRLMVKVSNFFQRCRV